MEGPEVEFLQDALKRVRQAAQERPLASQLSECRSFIERSERRLEKIDAERAAELVQVNEARSRLTRLEAQAAVLPPDIPRQPTADVSMELEELRAKLVSTERERDEALSAPACKPASHVTQCGGRPWHPTSNSRFVRSSRFVSLDGRSPCRVVRGHLNRGSGPHPDSLP